MHRLAIDIGGTFTDLFVYDEETGEITVAKGPTTPEDPSLGVVNVIEKAGVAMSEVVFFAHGSTIATNALVERKLAKTGLLTTKGFRDVLELRRGNRDELWDFYHDVAPSPVRRRDRLEVEERIDYTGKVLIPLDTAGVERAAEIFRRKGVEAVAVCFINAYVDGRHEREARNILKQHLPGVHVSVSHEILPEIFEFERTSTTVLNAALAPRVADYLNKLTDRLNRKGYHHDVLVVHSGGGAMTVQAAAGLASRIANSGPAAGAAAGAFIGRLCGFENALTLDMGGTSADIALTYKGQTRRSNEWFVEFGYPIRFPCVDMVSIGAGGGSVAWIDSGGSLRNGPRSMGADPGPACFNRGGTEPTNTDANLVLGRMSARNFLGGQMTVAPELAERAVEERIARPLGYNTVQAANAIVRVANANMADALRLISVRKGYDPREFALVIFGGAGPLHGAYLARELGIPTMIVPPWPGVTSALGCLMVDLMHDLSRSVTSQGERPDLAALENELLAMDTEAKARLLAEGVGTDRMEILRYIDMRYVGQWRSLTVACPRPLTEDSYPQVEQLFHREHGREYLYSMPEQGVEIHGLRVSGIGRTDRPRFKEAARSNGLADALKEERQVYFDESGGFVKTPVFQRDLLGAGAGIEGPAVVEQMDSTVVIPPRMRAEVDRYGNLLVRVI
jgi:N-methylhydantoinase A